MEKKRSFYEKLLKIFIKVFKGSKDPTLTQTLDPDPSQNFREEYFVVFERERRKRAEVTPFNLILDLLMKRGRGLTPINLFPNLDMGWRLTHQPLMFHSLMFLMMMEPFFDVIILFFCYDVICFCL